jgi:SAM-dependent methyltransferase
LTIDTGIKQVVRERYASAAVAKTSCCGPKSCADAAGPDLGLDMIGDAYADVDGYVADADLGLGCGLPTRHAGIQSGDVVLDLGSGAGIDAFVARRIVGETGRVIGVDMTPEMLERARQNAAKLGYDNVEFRFGEIEAPDCSQGERASRGSSDPVSL